MEISRPKADFTSIGETIAELEQLLLAIQTPQVQPCPHCQQGQDRRCHWQCQDAPWALSSDPAAHPIEPRLLRLVFELNILGVFQPCWSCQGHADSRGALHRLPQIFFYCARPLYAQLLHEHVEHLHHGGHLCGPWQIALASLGQSLGVTYVLQPAPYERPLPELAALQQDLEIIGDTLASRLRVVAEARLASLRMQQATAAAFYGQRL